MGEGGRQAEPGGEVGAVGAGRRGGLEGRGVGGAGGGGGLRGGGRGGGGVAGGRRGGGEGGGGEAVGADGRRGRQGKDTSSGLKTKGEGDRQERGDAGGRGAMDKEEEQEEEVDGNGQRGPDGRREDAAYTENFVGRRGAVRLGLLCLSGRLRGRAGGGGPAALVAEATPAAGVVLRDWYVQGGCRSKGRGVGLAED